MERFTAGCPKPCGWTQNREGPFKMEVASQPRELPGEPTRSASRWIAWTILAITAIAGLFLRWGGYILVAHDPLPAHVDAAVVLQGSILGERSRVAGAMGLLQRGVAARALLSVPRRSYWDEPIPPAAHRFVERVYGRELADRVDFCETGTEVNSTEDEARDLSHCIQEHGWQTVAIVTSDYHTRRAGMIWAKILSMQAPSVHMWIDGVSDPEFQPRGWWRHRLFAKTWFLESIKLILTVLTE